MVRIRPGRSWRLNPGYLERLQGLHGLHARRFDASAILDVVGIEIDGVDIAAGVGEAQVLLAVAELAEALVRLSSGMPAAQATVGPGPTEVLLESRGADVLLSLVRLARPGKVLAAGLLVDGARLRAAAQQAVRGLLEDLLAISAALADSPVARRLRKVERDLKARPLPALRWPPVSEAAPRAARALLLKSGPTPPRCEVHVPLEAAERLASPIEGAPLFSLLCRGSIALRLADAPALSFEGPIYLALRDAVCSAEALVQAWEAGDRTFELAFGPLLIEADLTRDELRAPGFPRPASATPLQIAGALAGAARTFALRATKLPPPGGPKLEALADLREAASALLRHCRDLGSGALRRHPEIVAAPPPRRAPAREARPLHPHGRVRRLVFRQSFSSHLPEAPSALQLVGRDPVARAAADASQGALVVSLAQETVGLDLEDGRRIWSFPCVGPRGLARAGSGSDVFVLGPDALVRVEAGSGEVRWRRKIPSGPDPEAAVLSAGSGVIVCRRGSVVLVAEGGAVAWRARLEQPPLAALVSDAALLLSLPGGLITALDLRSGRPLWRRRSGVQTGLPLLCAGKLVLSLRPAPDAACRVIALDPATGQPAWEHALDPVAGAAASLPALASAGDLVAVASGAQLTSLRAANGTVRFELGLPWPGQTCLAAAEDLDDGPRGPGPKWRGPTIVATGQGGAAACFDGAGRLAWSAESAGGDDAPQPALLARGLVLLGGRGLRILDAALGLPVAQLPSAPAGPLNAAGPERALLWAASADLTVALYQDGELRALQLASHLSVVS